MSEDRKQPPLTEGQIKMLRAAGAGSGSRAATISVRSGVPVESCYPLLARLVTRGLLAKSKGRPPFYSLTVHGARRLEASEAYQRALKAKG
jgi:DNA-binding MarR family transcriptional regulator